MALKFAELMFTPTVRAAQERAGSRQSYARMERPEAPARDRFGPAEAAFIAARDSFYMASVGETGWPYVQHRGGPAGFLKLLDDQRLGFADLSGNKQYVSVGNLESDDRVSLFLMDYPNRRRLKILGHAQTVQLEDAPWAADQSAERAIIITLEGFDWNCPQHITQRFTAEQIQPLIDQLHAVEAERDSLRAQLSAPSEPKGGG